jgi:hypothetical protein
MQGLNKLFMDDPRAFLATHSLRVRGRKDQYSPFAGLNHNLQPPIFQFDIQPAAVGVELILFAPHAKTHKHGTQRPITAYWLDYDPGMVGVVNINAGQADYLFTPLLDGCYVGVGNGHVVHVAGDIEGNEDIAQMRAHAQNALGGLPNIGFNSDTADAPMCTFIGARRQGLWNWYVQGHDYFTGNYGAVQAIFQNGVHAGNTVIRLTDLTLG